MHRSEWWILWLFFFNYIQRILLLTINEQLFIHSSTIHVSSRTTKIISFKMNHHLWWWVLWGCGCGGRGGGDGIVASERGGINQIMVILVWVLWYEYGDDTTVLFEIWTGWCWWGWEMNVFRLVMVVIVVRRIVWFIRIFNDCQNAGDSIMI